MTFRRPTRAGRAVVLLAALPVVAGLVGVAPSTSTAAPMTSRAPFAGTASKHGTANSLDWAGYAVTGATVTTVSGSWTQPAVSCTGKVTQSAFWVGIDGYAPTDPTVQQVGTDSDCTKKVHKTPGGPSYYAWFEMYPGPLVVLSPTLYPVTPGDSLSASVTLVGAAYHLVIADAGHWTFSTLEVATTVPMDASAEWIVEAPTTCSGGSCKPVGLADFTSVGFTAATANGQPVDASGFTSHQITMTKTKKGTIVKASTSALGAAGTAFNVTWVSS
jgi:hypothetical protein